MLKITGLKINGIEIGNLEINDSVVKNLKIIKEKVDNSEVDDTEINCLFDDIIEFLPYKKNCQNFKENKISTYSELLFYIFDIDIDIYKKLYRTTGETAITYGTAGCPRLGVAFLNPTVVIKDEKFSISGINSSAAIFKFFKKSQRIKNLIDLYTDISQEELKGLKNSISKFGKKRGLEKVEEFKRLVFYGK